VAKELGESDGYPELWEQMASENTKDLGNLLFAKSSLCLGSAFVRRLSNPYSAMDAGVMSVQAQLLAPCSFGL
jgi:hypothetical protein